MTDSMSTEMELAEALALLDQDPPTQTSTQAAVPAEALQTPAPAAAPEALSPTLSTLEMSRRPKEATVCERCPNSVWFTSPTEVKCYCRVMYLVTWSSAEPNQITGCDGLFLGQE